MENINFEKITLRLKTSSRGGGIEIDLSTLGYDGEKMTAYQNYLGGGMLGAICSDNTIVHKSSFTDMKIIEELEAISDQLKRYFHELTRHEDDEWEDASFEDNQKRPVSAY